MKKHDDLHNFELYRHCWCMCGDCWQAYGTKSQKSGKIVGRCVCRQCPCYVLF